MRLRAGQHEAQREGAQQGQVVMMMTMEMRPRQRDGELAVQRVRIFKRETAQ